MYLFKVFKELDKFHQKGYPIADALKFSKFIFFEQGDAKFDLTIKGLNCNDQSGLGHFAVMCAGEGGQDGIGWQKV